MRIFKSKVFNKWAAKEGLTDKALLAAVVEIDRGLIDADLGGHVIKKRVALVGRGKSGGARTLLAYRVEDKAFFVYGFAKNVRANIRPDELSGSNWVDRRLIFLRGLDNEQKTWIFSRSTGTRGSIGFNQRA